MEIILRDVGHGPIYKQIEEEIERNILNGNLKPRERMPSIRQFARDLRVSVITTKRAYEDLEMLGFLTAIPGKGYYVAVDSHDRVRRVGGVLLSEHLDDAVEEAKKMGMSLEELEALLRKAWEWEKEEQP